MEHLRYPNESTEYRTARNALLNDEIALRAQIETVAAKRRALPPGGKVSEDYVFERIGKNATPAKVKMSELFGSHDTLILYSFMYGPERELPCPGCTHLLDGIDGAARHMGQRAALHIVAKSSIARLAVWAGERGWPISRSCLRRVTITTQIILVTLQSFPRECVHSIASRKARTGTKQYLTCSRNPTERSVTFGARR
jgi:predicted dithiol-disulfide oxidoreductase (DUF899 family)